MGGDGNCDDKNNNCGCEYDGGDCCTSTNVKGEVNTNYCTACECLDPAVTGVDPETTPSSTCKDGSKCKNDKWKGDGNCDDKNNNCGCAYDGGDCCISTNKNGEVNKNYCNDCECMDPEVN